MRTETFFQVSAAGLQNALNEIAQVTGKSQLVVSRSSVHNGFVYLIKFRKGGERRICLLKNFLAIMHSKLF